MGLGDRLAFLVGADGVPETVAGFGRVAAAAKQAATDTEAQLAKLTAAAEAAEAKAAASSEKVVRGVGGSAGIARNQAAADRATADAQKARQQIAGIESGAAQGGAAGGVLETIGIGGATGAAVVAGVAVAGAAIAKFADDAISHYQRLGAQVLDFQREAGGTAEQDSRLVNVFNQLGVQSDAAGNAIFRLGHNAEGTGKTLAGVGVEVARNKDGSVDLTGTLANVVGAYQATDNAAERAAIAFAAFGRSGTALLPILAQSKEQLQALFAGAGGELFSQQDLENIEQARIASAQLKQSFGGLQDAVGRALTPLTTNFTRGLEVLGEDLGVFNRRQDQATAALSAWTLAQQKATAAARQATAEEQAQTAAVDSIVSSVLSARDADQAVADARQKVTEADLGWAQKASDVRSATEDLTKANEDLTSALYNQSQAAAVAAENQQRNKLAVRDSTFAVADAQDAYNRAVEEYGANSREAAEAADALAGKQLDVADAKRKANAPDTTIRDANDAVTRATDARTQAQDKLNKAVAENPDAAYQTAEDNLAKSVAAATAAHHNQTKAIQDQNAPLAAVKAAFDTYIADLKAAGADPSLIQWAINQENAVLAARQAFDQNQPQIPPPAPPTPPPVTYGPNNPAPKAAPGSPGDVNPKDVPGAEANLPPPQSSISATKAVHTQSVTNITVNANNTNMDPTEVGHAIVRALAVRR